MIDKLSKPDQQYYKKLKMKNNYYRITVVFFAVCSIILFIGTKEYALKISDNALGYLSGFFLSIILLFTLAIFRNRRLMKDPEKLKQQRIAKTDERNIEITNKALFVTCYVLIVTLVILSVVGSFVSQMMMMVSAGLIYVFFISYLIGYVYFRRKL